MTRVGRHQGAGVLRGLLRGATSVTRILIVCGPAITRVLGRVDRGVMMMVARAGIGGRRDGALASWREHVSCLVNTEIPGVRGHVIRGQGVGGGGGRVSNFC